MRWEEQNAPRATFDGTLSSLAPHLSGITFDQARSLTLLPASEFDAILRALQENPGSASRSTRRATGGSGSPSPTASTPTCSSRR